jgi:hypothetical protein
MNIFFLDSDPKKCAEQHCDKHVVKMILESAQLLSTAHHVLDDYNAPKGIYKPTHKNHPSAIWARTTDSNYDWLYVLWRELMSEYKYRYLKVHACEKLIIPLRRLPFNIEKGPFTAPPKAMPDEYKVEDTIQSYKNYYNGAKASFAKWTSRKAPEWFNA